MRFFDFIVLAKLVNKPKRVLDLDSFSERRRPRVALVVKYFLLVFQEYDSFLQVSRAYLADLLDALAVVKTVSLRRHVLCYC